MASLEKTGRFGLGFNSAYHFTDCISFVSQSSFCIFDPHLKYIPQTREPGLRVNFVKNSNLREQFSDQFDPYCIFGNDMKKPFTGTIFRFPLRKEWHKSEISDRCFMSVEVRSLLKGKFRKVVQETLLFLRNVDKIEVYEQTSMKDEMKLMYKATALGRSSVKERNEWNRIPIYIAGSQKRFEARDFQTKEQLYSCLASTPGHALPLSHLEVTMELEDEMKKTTSKKYMICQFLGAGRARAMAVDPKNFALKLLPLAGVAARLPDFDEDGNNKSDDKTNCSTGKVFTFLPLPFESGLPVEINGMFCLSSNRRDLWSDAEGMEGTGKIRAMWNHRLLTDVVAPTYVWMLRLLKSKLDFSKEFLNLFPSKLLREPWNLVADRTLSLLKDERVLKTERTKEWVRPQDALLVSEDMLELGQLLVKEKQIPLVKLPQNIIDAFSRVLKSQIKTVTPMFVLRFMKRNKKVGDVSDVLRLLKFVLSDKKIRSDVSILNGACLIPLASGKTGKFARRYEDPRELFVVSLTQYYESYAPKKVENV